MKNETETLVINYFHIILFTVKIQKLNFNTSLQLKGLVLLTT